MLLELKGIRTIYGAFEALRDISLEVDTGEVVTLLGANGAGKTTLLRTISGLVSPARGQIRYDGQGINKITPDAMVKKGISHCPEGKMLFPEMTVQKNLEMGAYCRRKDRRLVERLQ